ncbi:MAG: amino acid adenylation domain-containing protein [Pseudomonadales bacterium]
MRAELSARDNIRFSRREFRLEKSRWNRLLTFGKNEGLTPSGILLAAYSEVLARWSSSPHFTLNMTVSTRLPAHGDVNKLIGDFINLLLLEVDRRDAQQSFLEFALQLQQQLARDIEYSQKSGVDVLREWIKSRGATLKAAMPVVFSSGLVLGGDEEVGDWEQFGEKIFCISQTSQAWLDQHVVEIKGDLVVVWDTDDSKIEDSTLDDMFSAYTQLLENLADEAATWKQQDVVSIPETMWELRLNTNRSLPPRDDRVLTERRLHSGFINHARKNPFAMAVFSPERSLNYGELLEESCFVADALIAGGVSSGELVAVLMGRGWEQIVAVYGVLLAGAAYLPVDKDLPPKRQQELLHIGEVKQVIVQPESDQKNVLTDLGIAELEVIEVVAGRRADFNAKHADSLGGGLDELAYVIFTSGTTGVPKGVMIDHRGVINTIEHMNQLFDVTAADRVLAVSSLSFDLSVYDIFGLLDVGGSIVLPEYSKGTDPIHWRKLMIKHDVTVWNSAPQLMRMLMDSFHAGEEETSLLRVVFMSGDWIPLNLPDRIRNRYLDAEVISLGGATEASIWSIYYPINTIENSWSSIPYGKPLPKQQMWVYDYAMRPCPDNVIGRIFIGGIGLATGYWRDAEKTSTKFVIHPVTGDKLYDTGDIGRYTADGDIQMLGREDNQIKIRGHRVELGEIEAVLRQHQDISQCAVLPTVDVSLLGASTTGIGTLDNRQLAAYIELEGQSKHEFDNKALQDYLSLYLADYMIPRYLVPVDRIPLSSNGKIDHNALSRLLDDLGEEERDIIKPRNDIEQSIYDAWMSIIVDCEVSVTDNFFELGGDSVLATVLVREINETLSSFELEMHELFENLTVEDLAKLYEQRLASNAESTEEAQESGPQPNNRKHLLDDIQKAEDFFNRLNFSTDVSSRISSPEALLITGATGWIGTHLVAELLLSTDADLYCLVRSKNSESQCQVDRLLDNMRDIGVNTHSSWRSRLFPILGDLSQPQLGLQASDWQLLVEKVDAIYHFGASLNVMVDYSEARKVNVNPTVFMVALAVEHHLKPIYFCSPLTVCRRQYADHLVVLPDERAYPYPDGLTTGYACSKWTTEQILLGAQKRGLPIKIYRTSHALPSSVNGLAKANDTYAVVLKAAFNAGVAPSWNDSVMYGVPVDILGRLIVEDSISTSTSCLSVEWQNIIHIENEDHMSLEAILQVMLDTQQTEPINAWTECCRNSLGDDNPEEKALAEVLFRASPAGTAVESMFAKHFYSTDYFHRKGLQSKISNLTPAEYWRKVCRHQTFNVSVLH